MTIRHMRIFVEVYQRCSITRAAEALHLAQPSVSLAVKELEDYYGIRLFDRLGRRICPTEGASMFYGYALHIVSLFDELELHMKNRDALGTLSVGTSITIGTHILPQLIRAFDTVCPGVRVQAVVSNSAEIERNVLNNTIDLGLIETQPEHEELCSVPFLRDALAAVVAPSHPLACRSQTTLEELARYPFLMRERGSAGREILDACFSAQQLTVHPILESSSTQAIVSAVAEELGVAVLPELLVERDVRDGLIRVLPLSPPLKRELNIIHHKSKYLTPNMCAFWELCLQYGSAPQKAGQAPPPR